MMETARRGRGLTLFLLKNLLRMLVLLISVSIVTFALVSLSPLDPLQANIGQAALGSLSAEQIAKLESYWGVNEPPVKRYLAWAGDFLQGDMGTSLLYRKPVSTLLAEKLSNSLGVLALAWAISGLLGFALGVAAGAKRGGALDKCVQGYSLLMASTPTFWLALLLLLVFAVWLKVLPIGLSVPIGAEAGTVTLFDRVRHAILPALTLSVSGISGMALHTREKMIDAMQSDYALFAAARGESRGRIALRHGVRNALLPAITLQFASIGEIIGGSVLVEQIFSYPGIGQMAVAAGLGSDVALLMGVTMVSAALVFAGNFLANLLYGLIDPRIRRGGMRR